MSDKAKKANEKSEDEQQQPVEADALERPAGGGRNRMMELQVRRGEGIVLETVEDVWQFAAFATRFGLVPRSFFNKDTNQWNLGGVTVAVIKGQELDMKPTQAVQSIYVVNQQPALWGDAVPGLVLASGHLEDFRESYEGEPYDDGYTAVCTVKRRGITSEHTERFSVAMAKTANLWGKTGYKGAPTPWVTNPDRMLKIRARTFAYRALFADVLKGLGVAEELLDIQADRDALEAPPEFASQQEAFHAAIKGGEPAEEAEA